MGRDSGAKHEHLMCGAADLVFTSAWRLQTQGLFCATAEFHEAPELAASEHQWSKPSSSNFLKKGRDFRFFSLVLWEQAAPLATVCNVF